MVRADDSKFLLYIEPTHDQRSADPVNDEYTQILRLAMSEARKGTANYSDVGKEEVFSEGHGYRGWHTCSDGTFSDNHDYQLPNGLITNSLCIHYLTWYRSAVSHHDWEKLDGLMRHYGRVNF